MTGSVASVHRERPLSLRLAAGSIALSAGDVNLVLQGIDALVEGPHASHLGELVTLRDELVTASASLFAPPLRIDADEARLLRNVLLDLTGYQRVELTSGLRELQQLLIPV
jgi:hypothetical protein